MPERFHSPDDQGLAPAVRDRPPVPALGAVQAAHHVWLESAGRQGHQADLWIVTGLMGDQPANASGDPDTRLPDRWED
ncbi:hypothetical protein [Azospirillum sp. sgz302134]